MDATMKTKQGVTRRSFVQIGAAIAAGAGLSTLPACSTTVRSSAPISARKPKNVIFMVSDGMSAGVLSLAERFAQDCLGRGTQWAALLTDPAVTWGSFDTASLSSPVTDSAAASSAWGSGSRVANGAINSLPDGTLLTPIAQLVRGTGRRVGLVTTATVTHATPAGFAVAQAKRNDEGEIAEQYRDAVDIALGGGAKFFPASLVQQYQNSGYTVVRNKGELAAAGNAARMLGIFSDEHMPFTVDHINDPALLARVPTLSEMTRTALDSLVRNDRGFLLQVEGARIDHAAHANDVPGLLHDQLAFDDAVKLVLEFARNRDDTLVIITTDHGNSNPGLLGMGTNYNDSGKLFANLGPMKASYSTTLAAIRRQAPRSSLTATHVNDVCKERLQVELRPDRAKSVADVMNLTRIVTPLHPQLQEVVGVFGQVMVPHTGVAWMGTTHTSDYAVLSALGPGANRFRGILKNNHAFDVLTELLDCPFKNPALTVEQAKRFPQASADSEDFSWLRTMLA
jgi:alkaline phosphatase